jgi:hypothetical protein
MLYIAMIIHPTIKFHINYNKFKPSHYTLHVQVLPKVLADIYSMSPLLPNEVVFLVLSIW